MYLYYQNNQFEKAKNVLAEMEKSNQLTKGLMQFKKRFQKISSKERNLYQKKQRLKERVYKT